MFFVVVRLFQVPLSKNLLNSANVTEQEAQAEYDFSVRLLSSFERRLEKVDINVKQVQNIIWW
jgi:hypothetical protein